MSLTNNVIAEFDSPPDPARRSVARLAAHQRHDAVNVNITAASYDLDQTCRTVAQRSRAAFSRSQKMLNESADFSWHAFEGATARAARDRPLDALQATP
jgi:hypothetical protein